MTTVRPFELPVMADPLWQMTYGERFAIEGVLSQVKPLLAIETGTAQGGSLRRLAAHSVEVHAFDIEPEVAKLGDEIANATIHIGDSRATLPDVLAGFAGDGRDVDFALIDGDHTFEGVQHDLEAVLASDACRHTIVLIHDTANDVVRAGLDAMDLPARPKVALCMLDFVPGYMVVEGHPVYSLDAWNGLGILVLDPGAGGPALVMDDRISVADLYREARAARLAQV
jgi:Methyltransferase domain